MKRQKTSKPNEREEAKKEKDLCRLVKHDSLKVKTSAKNPTCGEVRDSLKKNTVSEVPR